MLGSPVDFCQIQYEGQSMKAWPQDGTGTAEVQSIARHATHLTSCCRYGTFSELAGIDPTDWRAAAAKLPPVDSHSLVPVLMGTGVSTRKEIPIGTEPRLMTL